MAQNKRCVSCFSSVDKVIIWLNGCVWRVGTAARSHTFPFIHVGALKRSFASAPVFFSGILSVWLIWRPQVQNTRHCITKEQWTLTGLQRGTSCIVSNCSGKVKLSHTFPGNSDEGRQDTATSFCQRKQMDSEQHWTEEQPW